MNDPYVCALPLYSLTQPEEPNAPKANIAGDRCLHGDAETEKTLIKSVTVGSPSRLVSVHA